MTTEAAARLDEAQHVYECQGNGLAVYNPHGKPVGDLPIIWGFINSHSAGGVHAMTLAEDGTELGGHFCSSPAYAPADLGLLEGSRPDRHERYRAHYPDGYRMSGLVQYDDVDACTGLQLAIKQAEAQEVAS